ncbi:hypothetical protein [Nonomuraea sp. NPDC050310]|uniref:hypothetical protein n=1 Tax=Nonomuraea sp. NPDC050310 TaxID=3154935 RepID=UPI0033CCC820
MVLLGGGGVVALIYALDDKPSTTVVAYPEATKIPTEPATEPAPEETTPEPSPEESTTPAEEPSETPSTTTQGKPLTVEEFGADWNFRLGETAFQAERVGGWRHDTCGPLDGKNKPLSKNDCDHGVLMAYSGYGGKIKANVVLLAFPDEEQAKAALKGIAVDSNTTIRWRMDLLHKDFAYGKIRYNSTGRYVVATVVTGAQAEKTRAERFHRYLQTDFEGVFVFRG